MRSRTIGPDRAPFPLTRRAARLAERRTFEAGPGEGMAGPEPVAWDGRFNEPVLFQPDDVLPVGRRSPLPVQRTASRGESPLPPIPLRPPGPPVVGRRIVGRHAASAASLGQRLRSLSSSMSGPGAPRPRGRRAR